MSTTCPASIRQGLQEVIANIARPLSPVYTPQSCFCSVASGSRAALDLHPGAFQQDLRSGAFRHTVAVVAPYMIYPRGALWREQPLPTSFCSSSSGHPILFHKCVSSSSPASSSKASHASNVLTFISQVPIALFPCLSSSFHPPFCHLHIVFSIHVQLCPTDRNPTVLCGLRRSVTFYFFAPSREN